MPRFRPILLTSCLILLSAQIAVMPARAMDTLPASHPTYQGVKRIYDAIARSFGNGRPAPRLLVVPASSRPGFSVAVSDAGSEGSLGVSGNTLAEGYVAIEERAIELLSRFGPDRDNAVAFLLGHELTHYYLRHGWVGDFGNAFVATEMGKKMIAAASYDDAVRRETEADYFGGFYSFLAGYDTLRVGPEVLDLLYAAYGIPDRLDNYPSRSERKAIAQRTAADLERLVPLFDAATRLLIIGRYEEAGRLFGHLAAIFPGREIFTNAGVAYAQEALRLFRPGAVAYAYPFEFDAETRLCANRFKTRGPDELAGRRTQLLQAAQEAFEQAIRQDRSYAPAYVNLASVQSLLGEHDQAALTARKGLELARTGGELPTVANALVVQGIAHALSGDTGRARIDFSAAKREGASLAAVNLAVLDGRHSGVAPPAAELPGTGRETVAGRSPWDGLPADKAIRTFTLHATAAGEQPITVRSASGSGWEASMVASGGRQSVAIATAAGHTGATARGIAIGTPMARLREKYGIPARLVPSRQGVWHLYPTAGIAFRVDADQRVGGWLLFAGG